MTRKFIKKLAYLQLKLEQEDKEKLERYLSKYGQAHGIYSMSEVVRRLIREMPER